MTSFSFKLATKSFFYNVSNDNEKGGHTATVATALKQGHSVAPELHLFEQCKANVFFEKNRSLIRECDKNSKTAVKITNVLVFNDIFVNGEKIECDSQFCLYIKEEVDPSKVQYGRKKLHYPFTLAYSDSVLNIDNKKVVKAISKKLNDYAFLVKEIEIIEDGTAINFKTILLGQRGIPYSKVFRDYKGDSIHKFSQAFNEIADSYEIEIINMKNVPGLGSVSPDNYPQAYEHCKEKALEIVTKKLEEIPGVSEIMISALEYPYSVVDIECLRNKSKNYYIVVFTTTSIDYFFLSRARFSFLADFDVQAKVVLVKNIMSEQPVIKVISQKELNNAKRTVQTLKYEL